MASEDESGCVFPTCVGMNRQSQQDRRHHVSVPHMRGDEPRGQ